jgi:hypothetical protein
MESAADDCVLHDRAYPICAQASQTVIDTIQQLDKYQLLREACADFLYIISLTTLFQSEPRQSVALMDQLLSAQIQTRPSLSDPKRI